MLSKLYVRVVGISAHGIGQKYMTFARVGSPRFHALIKSEGSIMAEDPGALTLCLVVFYYHLHASLSRR